MKIHYEKSEIEAIEKSISIFSVKYAESVVLKSSNHKYGKFILNEDGSYDIEIFPEAFNDSVIGLATRFSWVAEKLENVVALLRNFNAKFNETVDAYTGDLRKYADTMKYTVVRIPNMRVIAAVSINENTGCRNVIYAGTVEHSTCKYSADKDYSITRKRVYEPNPTLELAKKMILNNHDDVMFVESFTTRSEAINFAENFKL